MLSQVSIFAENKKGRLQNITSLLQKENINIWGSITNDVRSTVLSVWLFLTRARGESAGGSWLSLPSDRGAWRRTG